MLKRMEDIMSTLAIINLNMDLKIMVLLLLFPFVLVDAYACTQPLYCLSNSSLIYASGNKLVVVSFNEKLSKNSIKLPEAIIHNIRGKVCTLKCYNGGLNLLTSDKEYNLKIIKKSEIQLRSEKKSPASYSDGPSLGRGAKLQTVDAYSDAVIKVTLEVSHTENIVNFKTYRTLEHTYKAKLVKINQTSGKKIEELVLYEDFSDEGLD